VKGDGVGVYHLRQELLRYTFLVFLGDVGVFKNDAQQAFLNVMLYLHNLQIFPPSRPPLMCAEPPGNSHDGIETLAL